MKLSVGMAAILAAASSFSLTSPAFAQAEVGVGDDWSDSYYAPYASGEDEYSYSYGAPPSYEYSQRYADAWDDHDARSTWGDDGGYWSEDNDGDDDDDD